ncbi:PaaI family thioesterase [Roseinatronobacter alkalisoli]|uniref:PaaI family thioesterase n=1 Tax=Roseinatronobacter alkalisoli TaxID=3028235 RepID=A0ABT5T9Z3_9RHOB|nr:PaaI family thioesterase [Roseinatronobacter sp. HJB301]MDD7971794.1 PaaI family thioesterase [Roseinatronobacter sp. HJB301]
MNRETLTEFLKTEFRQVAGMFAIDDVGRDRVTVRLLHDERHLRPGGTVSGPAMFALADVSVYLAILSMVGPKALSVTTNCSIDFMRKPASGVDLVCQARILKLGRALAVGDCLIYSEGMENPVARASLTYSIPPAPDS